MIALVMGLITYGLVEAGDNTASSAAREGARVGILQYENADQESPTPSAAHIAIREAAFRQMGSGLVANFDVTVRCLRAGADGSLSPLGSTGACDPDLVERGRDLIEVALEWDPVGPVQQPRRSELARMTIVGRPSLGETAVTTPIDTNPDDEIPTEYQPDDGETVVPVETTLPPDCVISKVTLSPYPVVVKVSGSNNSLNEDVVYRAETNGAANCGPVRFEWPSSTSHGTTVAPNPEPEDNAYIGALDATGSSGWSVGTYTLRVVAANGQIVTVSFETVAHNKES